MATASKAKVDSIITRRVEYLKRHLPYLKEISGRAGICKLIIPEMYLAEISALQLSKRAQEKAVEEELIPSQSDVDTRKKVERWCERVSRIWQEEACDAIDGSHKSHYDSGGFARQSGLQTGHFDLHSSMDL
ncbi:hypothetical protein EJB05_33620, partial [Eragrostis curvula]